ncbi:nucleotidyltransferase [Flavobacterium branchiarum]|uniref:Nucleotidyltransferase n=1 Tax=Flavobacterium branchiarum TaxID=1114870 RepID=A0ABV5FQU8_9FLAO|nr:nucleotidyltransferase [Flavobacterium branchiarum]MDN3671702.1 nucleotidyltransferase [Flavobacterium branchiarum]
MRTKALIKQDLTTPFMANETMAIKYGFTAGDLFSDTFAIVSFENFIFEIIATAIFIHELFFDQHKKEVDDTLANKKPGTKPWYRTMALQFQYGFDLVADKDYYDNTGFTGEVIEASKIVKYSAVNEATESSRVIVKIAGEISGNLAPIAVPQKEAFDAYMEEIRIAGVQLTIINYLPDRLYLTIQIKRDALVLAANGMSIINANYPVNDAIAEFMKELPFDGELRLSALVDKLQVVPGVLDATIVSASSSWINPLTNGYELPQPIYIATIPISGYFEVQGFENVNYVV